MDEHISQTLKLITLQSAPVTITMQLAIKGNQLQQDLENENGGAASRRFASRKVLGAKLVFDGDDENSGRAVVAPLEVGDLCHSRLMTHLFWHHLLIKPQTSISTRIAIVPIPDICHFFTLAYFEAWKFYTQKCVNLRQKLPRDKTA